MALGAFLTGVLLKAARDTATTVRASGEPFRVVAVGCFYVSRYAHQRQINCHKALTHHWFGSIADAH